MVWNTKLTDDQVDKIFELSAPLPDGRRRSAQRIAEMLGVSKNAVSWQMYRHGLRPKGKAISVTPRVRKDGIVVRPYSADEDAFISSQRVAGKTYAEIRFISSGLMVETVEDWSNVRSPGRARRRRWKHRQNIIYRVVPRNDAFFLNERAGQQPAIVAHPDVIARVKARLETHAEAVKREADFAYLGLPAFRTTVTRKPGT